MSSADDDQLMQSLLTLHEEQSQKASTASANDKAHDKDDEPLADQALRAIDSLHVDRALVRERLEPEDAVIAAHAALVDATERQLVFQVVGEESVDRHAAR